MRPYLQWALYVSGATTAGALAGWSIGAAILRLDLDYLPDVSLYVDRGWRAGLFTGAYLAACALMGRRGTARPSAVLRGALLVWVGVLAASAATGAIMYLMSREHLLSAPEGLGVQAGNPNRFYLCRGIEWGAGISAGILPALVGWRTVAARRARRGPTAGA